MFRSAFFGTPEIAVPALHALTRATEVVGVVCQPDRPAGRGMQLAEPAVKRAAASLGLEVHQPVKVKHGSLDVWLRERNVDVAVVMAYGRILPPPVLGAPRFGCVNLHASLLPRYRGAAPINWALFNDEPETGISLMQMDAGLDTGPVFCQRKLRIDAGWNAGELSERLAQLAALVIEEDLEQVFAGNQPVAQDPTLATHAPPFGNPELAIDWQRSALQINNQIRAFAPRPGAHSWLGGKRLRITRASALPAGQDATEREPGTVAVAEGAQLLIATGSGLLRIERAQLEGKRELEAKDLVNGRTLQRGQVLRTPGLAET